jgi:hypothetical protein
MTYILNLGEENDPRSISLVTKKGKRIKNARPDPRHPDSMAAAEKYAKKYGNEDFRTRSLLSTYNCMGLVFGSRRTVIDVDDVEWILQDDGFGAVLEQDVLPGDLLLYRDANGPTHIAVVVEHRQNFEKACFETTVVSQWGDNGEYVHRASDVSPILGKPSRFYRMKEE